MKASEKLVSPARLAREQAGLTLQRAAHLARVGEPYLRRIESAGGVSYHMARKLTALYGGCSIHCFLPQHKGTKGGI